MNFSGKKMFAIIENGFIFKYFESFKKMKMRYPLRGARDSL